MNEKDKDTKNPPEKKRNPVASVVIGLVGAFCGFYLLNPTAGTIEIIPDIVPFIGNLDEAGAAALLVSCLAYFGLDVGAIFGRFKKGEDVAETKTTTGEVIDSESNT